VSRKGRNITNLRLSGCCDRQKEGASLEHVTPHAAKKGFLCFPRQAKPQQAREWPKWRYTNMYIYIYMLVERIITGE
jgi:hypothetical protein